MAFLPLHHWTLRCSSQVKRGFVSILEIRVFSFAAFGKKGNPYQFVPIREIRVSCLVSRSAAPPASVEHWLALTYRVPMPSFDIVSRVNSMEVENAVNQSRKELANRFDFKGSTAEIRLENNEIKLSAEDQFKLRALVEIVMSKIAKRGISLKSVDKGEPEVSPLGHARQVIRAKQGLEQAVAKQITGMIRERKFKVTSQIQADEIRVASKSKDELQTVIAAVRSAEFPAALQFVNFRD
jgi:uncharacterized protein YajQ (UPF0234 family)